VFRQSSPLPRSVPNYLTIDPTTGAVGADFTGKIHAQGLDLDAALQNDDTLLIPANSVQWKNGTQIDGAIQATDQVGVQQTVTVEGTGPNNAVVRLAARRNNSASQPAAFLSVVDNVNSGKQLILATAGIVVGSSPGQQITVLDSDGRSSFPQMSAIANARILWGYFTSLGATINTNGITCTRVAVGQYNLSWSAFAAAPAVIPHANDALIAEKTGITTVGGTIVTTNALAGAGIDDAFSIIVIGA
jgi:hypothetical protein